MEDAYSNPELISLLNCFLGTVLFFLVFFGLHRIEYWLEKETFNSFLFVIDGLFFFFLIQVN